MPRANRHYIPGQVWHLTQRCTNRDFLLRKGNDRERWCYWLAEARRRFGLCVLNYIVTSNHVHLLVQDRGDGEICRSMQLIAGRMAQEYNLRSNRNGPYWQDRYHSTAVESGLHLARCVIYIDLNMVRARKVTCPDDWRHTGFHEIQTGTAEIQLIDRAQLSNLLGLTSVNELAAAHRTWHDSDLGASCRSRNPGWTHSLAVGSSSFVHRFRRAMGARGLRFAISETRDGAILHDPRGRRIFAGPSEEAGTIP